jgi:hypothetical protein
MSEAMQTFVRTFFAARTVSTPLVAVRTPDPASSIRAISEAVASMDEKARIATPLVCWDVIRGLAGLNPEGKRTVKDSVTVGESEAFSQKPTDALEFAEAFAEDTILFFINAHRFYDDPGVAQGIWNLRDPFKSAGKMLVLLTTPGATLPPELSSDVLVLDEPLPSISDLERIVLDTYTAADLNAPGAETLTRATDALIGLGAFPAEQALAMSLTPKGLDTAGLWERKRKLIEQTPGLSIWRGKESFDQIGGADNIKQFLTAVFSGIDPPRVIGFIDEIEKAFAGFGTDTSGVKTDMTGTMLTLMQDLDVDGCLFLGPPGCAKSAVGKSVGNLAGKLTIGFDFSAMQNSEVGKSGERLRAAFNIMNAISEGRMLFIATCNSIGSLPAELRRRFKLGTFFFDLPTPQERQLIWEIYRKKYNVLGKLPDDDNWTGAEIKECCHKAYRLRISLEQAASYVVPVARSAGEQIKTLRMQASGKYISASTPGVYQYDESAPSTLATPARRKIREEATRAV